MEEIRVARRANTNKRAEARLKALELRAMGKSSNEIGVVTGFHPAYIAAWVGKGVVPRSRHPKKADKEVIEASKKLTFA